MAGLRELGFQGMSSDIMVQDAGLALNDGRGFGPEGGGYMRMKHCVSEGDH